MKRRILSILLTIIISCQGPFMAVSASESDTSQDAASTDTVSVQTDEEASTSVDAEVPDEDEKQNTEQAQEADEEITGQDVLDEVDEPDTEPEETDEEPVDQEEPDHEAASEGGAVDDAQSEEDKPAESKRETDHAEESVETEKESPYETAEPGETEEEEESPEADKISESEDDFETNQDKKANGVSAADRNADSEQELFDFEVIDQNSVAITGYLGEGGTVTIPETINGSAVKAISDGAFQNKTSITSIVFPEGLKTIGSYAFSGCTSLSGDLTLPESLESLGAHAFENDGNLKGKLTLPSGLSQVPEAAFKNCGFTGTLELPEGLGAIGSSAFEGCSGLTGELGIPNSVTELGPRAFASCSGFTGSLTIGDGISDISYGTFHGCSGISEVVIGANVEFMYSYDAYAQYVFGGCSGISSITFKGEEPPKIHAGRNYSGNGYVNHFFGSGSMSRLDVIYVPAGSYSAYYEAYGDSLQSRTKIREEGGSDFITEGSTLKLYQGTEETVTVPEGITRIGDGAFRSNSSMKEVNLPEGLTVIGDSAFRDCTALSGITIPDSVTQIGEYAFSGCTSLSGDLTLPESLESLGAHAFENDGNLKGKLTLPSGLAQIPEAAFKNCGFTGTLGLPEGLSAIGSSAFEGCSGFTGELGIPNSVTELGSKAFEGCSGLTGELGIPNSVTELGPRAFASCSGFTGTLTIGDGISDISYGTFHGCSGVSEVVIGANVEYMYAYYNYADYVFGGCSGISSITFEGEEPPKINSSKNSTGNAFVGDFFGSGSMSSLDVIYVPAGSYSAYYEAYGDSLQSRTKIREEGGSDFITEGSILKLYQGTEETVTVPEGITRIEGGAFRSNPSVKEVILPEGLTVIGDSAFRDCTALSGITIPGSVTQIGNYAFSGCTSLSGDLTLPGSLESLGAHAFENDGNLKGKLTLPSGLSQVPGAAFKNCGFTGTLELPEGLGAIGSSAFEGCSGLTGELGIPNSVTELGSRAFASCSGFTGTLTIGDGISDISYGTFHGCSGISEVVIGANVEYMYAYYNYADYVFGGCSGISGITFEGEEPPKINSSKNSTGNAFVGDFFGSGSMSSLDVIYVPAGSYSAYYEAYGDSLQSRTKIREEGGSDFITEGSILKLYQGTEETVTVPEGITRIEGGAFRSNPSVKEVILPEGLTVIGDSAFRDCTALSGITIPGSVTQIGNYAFSGCTSLGGDLTLPGSLESLGAHAFENDGNLKGELTLPSGLAQIPEAAFKNCGFTGTLELPEGLSAIGSSAFEGCSGLTGELGIPNSVTELGSRAFASCSGFTGTLTIGDGISDISYGTFHGCSGISEVVIGANVEYMYAYYNYADYVFGGCSGISGITFEGEEPPKINSSKNSTGNAFVGDFFGSGSMRNLDVINVLPEALSAYEEAYGAYLPEGVSFASDVSKLPVSGLRAAYVGSRSVDLVWEAAQGVTGYRIERDGTFAAAVSEPAYQDADLETGRQVTYTVRGVLEGGRFTPARSITVTPAAPKVKRVYTMTEDNRVGAASNKIYGLAADTGNNAAAEGRFFLTLENGDRYQIGGTITSDCEIKEEGVLYQTALDISDIEAGTYSISFELKDREGETDHLDQTITVVKNKPSAIESVAAVGDNSRIIVSWTMAKEIASETYRLYRRGEDQTSFGRIAEIEGRDTLSYEDKKATGSQKYYYYVTAVNDLGEESDPSPIASASTIADTQAPEIRRILPAGGSVIGGTVSLSALAADNTSVTQTWLEASEDEGSTWETLGTANGASVSYTLYTAKYSSETILVRALARDAAGNVSDPVVIAYTIDNTPPGQVTGLTAETDANMITLHWNDVEADDFSFFRVEKISASGTFVKVADVYDALGICMDDLQSDTEYTYRVAAYDKRGHRGEPSDVLIVRTAEDNIAPVITKQLPESGSYSTEMQTAFTAKDNTGINRIVIQTSPNSFEWTDVFEKEYDSVSPEQTLQYTLDLTGYAEGPVFVRAVATDFQGNMSEDSPAAPYVEHRVDRTAPGAVRDLKADASAGGTKLSWKQGEEEDLAGYNVYRSADRSQYEKIAEKTEVLQYADYNVTAGDRYWYCVCAVDQAGNESERTEPVSISVTEDTTAPEILSISPKTDYGLGPGNRKVSALISDDRVLDHVLITYTVNDSESIRTAVERNNINNYYDTVEGSISLLGLTEGDTVRVLVTAVDAAGNTSDQTVEYTVDLTPPDVDEVYASGETGMIAVTWAGGAEEDLACYRIYRSGSDRQFNLIREVEPGESLPASDDQEESLGTEFRFEDTGVSPEQAYSYRVEAVDKSGNTAACDSEETFVIYEPKLVPQLITDAYMKADTEYWIDAGKTESDLDIDEFAFDFGDGTYSNGKDARVIHRYDAPGVYEVTLSVTDIEGNTAVVSRTVTVEEASLLGVVNVHLGPDCAGFPIYFDIDSDSPVVKYADIYGNAAFTCAAGSYSVGAYAPGYIPDKVQVTAAANESVDVYLDLSRSPLVTGDFSVNRMTLDDLHAAEINVNDPDNQHMFKVNLNLTYTDHSLNYMVPCLGGAGSKPFKNEYIDTPQGPREVSIGILDFEEPVLYIVDVPIEASFLKEFFDIRVYLLNNAGSSFTLKDNRLKLNLPDGLTCMSASVQNIPIIGGQQMETADWVVRGDSAGDYTFNADYTGTLEPFHTEVRANIESGQRVSVAGRDALTLVADISETADYGTVYFDLSIKNSGAADMYMPKLNVCEDILDMFVRKREKDQWVEESHDQGITHISTSVTNQYGTITTVEKNKEIPSLASGEKYTKSYAMYGFMQDKDEGYLLEAIAEAAEGMFARVEINRVRKNMYSLEDADEKVARLQESPELQSIMEEISNDDLYCYTINGYKNNGFMFKAVDKAYSGAKLLLQLDFDAFSDEDIRDATKQIVADVLFSTEFADNVKMKTDLTYVDSVNKLVSSMKNELSHREEDGNFDVHSTYDLLDALDADQIRELADIFHDSGKDTMLERLAIMIGAQVVAGELHIANETLFKGTFITEKLNEIGEAEFYQVTLPLSVISGLNDCWADAQSESNDLITINASREEALALINTLKNSDGLNPVVLDELNKIEEGLINGFDKQDELFKQKVDSMLKQEAASFVVKKTGKAVKDYFLETSRIKTSGFANSVAGFLEPAAVVYGAASIGFSSVDYLTRAGDSLDMHKKLAASAAISNGLLQDMNRAKESGDSTAYLKSVAYMIKMRLEGEKQFIQLLKECRGEDDQKRILNDYNELWGLNCATLDEYYRVFRDKMIIARDQIFGSVPHTLNIPAAPAVSINYARETTNESFSNEFEYSFDGSSWSAGENKAIELHPAMVGKYIWVRKSASVNSMAGNIKKCYIPPRSRFPKKVTIEYLNGVYTFKGLPEGSYRYSFSRLGGGAVIQSSGAQVRVANPVGKKQVFMWIPAGPNGFASEVQTIAVQDMDVKTTQINASGFSLFTGQSKNIGAVRVPSGSTQSLNYASSNTKVATVSNTGLVKAIAKGTTVITITSGSITRNITIKVGVRTTAINAAGFSIYKNESKSIGAKLTPSDSTQPVKYASSNTKVATVSNTGLVKAIAKGTTVITITSGSITRNITIKVGVRTTAINAAGFSIYKNKSKSIGAKLTPSDSTQPVKYASSNKRVATVSATGIVKAVGRGTATITITSGSITKKIKVKVLVATKKIVARKLSVKKGKKAAIKAKFYPSDRTDKATYTSSNKKVVKVSAKGVVTGVKKGTAYVTIKSGKIKKKIKVTVK